MAKRKKRHGIEYSENREQRGLTRFSLAGSRHKRFAWDTPAAAKVALSELKRELENKSKEPGLPPTALITVVSAYLIQSGRDRAAADGR